MITIDRSRCKGCGECASACPAGAITLMEGTAYVDETLCLDCETCVNVCPHDAIICVETVEPVLDGEAFPEPELALSETSLTTHEHASPPSGGEVIPLLASIAVDLLDRRIQANTTDSRVERRQHHHRNRRNQAGRQRRHRRHRHGKW